MKSELAHLNPNLIGLGLRELGEQDLRAAIADCEDYDVRRLRALAESVLDERHPQLEPDALPVLITASRMEVAYYLQGVPYARCSDCLSAFQQKRHARRQAKLRAFHAKMEAAT